ncbi:MAG: hypothetical protein HRU17_21860 [Polyangiaceae bacterium]|nr:hypothetical protein [Polyangiaceae bacterium]
MHVATTPHLVARQLKRAPRVRPSRAFNPGPPHIRRSRCLGGDGCTLFRKRPHHLSTLRALDVSPRVQARGGNKDDGIDHPLWMYHRDAGGQVYFEVDTLGNVRRLVTPDGDSVGGYDYTAFGRTVTPTDDVLPSDFAQPLRWQGRPFFEHGGEGIYDFRARWWSPELGAFTTADEFYYLTDTGTLWSWPGQNPFALRDPSGRFGLVGAGLGALGGALAGGIGGYLTGGMDGIAGGALGGLVSGGLIGFTGGLGMGLGATLSGGVASGLAGLSVGNAYNALTGGPPPTPGDIATAAAGGVLGQVGGAALRPLATPGLVGEMSIQAGSAIGCGAVGAAVSNETNEALGE